MSAQPPQVMRPLTAEEIQRLQQDPCLLAKRSRPVNPKYPELWRGLVDFRAGGQAPERDNPDPDPEQE